MFREEFEKIRERIVVGAGRDDCVKVPSVVHVARQLVEQTVRRDVVDTAEEIIVGVGKRKRVVAAFFRDPGHDDGARSVLRGFLPFLQHPVGAAFAAAGIGFDESRLKAFFFVSVAKEHRPVFKNPFPDV